jgi:hypothetical protein
MILRSLSNPEERTSDRSNAQSASAVFIETQKHVEAPYAIIFQAGHAKLAGDLAEALSEDAFGGLPPEVIQAVSQHDIGWDPSDKSQIESLGQTSPRPFPSLSAQETLPSWHRSVANAQSVAPLVYVLVSRHFSLLGRDDPDRADFVRAETERRAGIERALPYAPADLDRWTGALGFCDLLSLYLCSGSHQPVEFPMAHPADPAAAHAPKITLSFDDRSPHFSSQVFKSGTHVSLMARSYSGRGTDLSPLALDWRFARV